MTISILGCGWYGLALAKAYIADEAMVKGSTTSAEKLALLEAEGIAPYLIDLAEEISINHRDFFTCDMLVIAIPPKSRSGEGEAYVVKMQHVVDAINKYEVKKVILISSTGVYADLNREVTEQTDPQPNTPSGQILLQAEEIFRQQITLKTTIIRFGGLIGPGRDPGRFFAEKKDIANGLAPINLIHLYDCIGITKAIITQGVFSQTINACTPHHPTRLDFYTQAAAKAGLVRPEFIPELKEWKIINSVAVGESLQYAYQINSWFDWLA